MESLQFKLIIFVLAHLFVCQIFTKHNSKSCKKFPTTQCKFIVNPNKEYKLKRLICENEFKHNFIKDFEKMLLKCPDLLQTGIHVIFKFHHLRQIVNHSFDAFRLDDISKKSKLDIKIEFLSVKGFDIESKIQIRSIWDVTFYSDFNLYKNNRVVKSCIDFQDMRSSQFIFVKTSNLLFTINKPKSVYPICSLFFRNARILLFSIGYMANSYYLKNTLTFTDGNKTIDDLNSKIYYFNIVWSYGITVDSKLLNVKLFANTFDFGFDSSLVSEIHVNVFRPFKKLNTLAFYSPNLIDVIRKQGIEWIKSINADLHVDKVDLEEMIKHIDRIVRIFLFNDRYFHIETNVQFAKDEDFCLFADFPFKQLIFFYTDSNNNKDVHFFNKKSTPFTCTEKWLLKYNSIAFTFFPDMIQPDLVGFNFSNLLSSCRFEQRLKLCNKRNFPAKITKKFTKIDFLLLFELFIIILTSLSSAYGVVTNLIFIIVIYHKVNSKTMREKHYTYMSLHCVLNILIEIIQILTLMNECQYPFGFYCSSIRQIVAVQYVKIVLNDYFNSLLRLLTNFAYFGFSVCRLAKIGKDHGKFIVFMNEKLSIKKYMGFWLIITAGLTICKALQFEINYTEQVDAFPIPFSRIRSNWIFSKNYVAISVINMLNDMITYLLFVFVHLIVDLVLVKKLRQVIQEKENKMKEMKKGEKELEKASRENEESKRRTLFMVILSSILNFVCKVPLMITSFNDLRIMIRKPYAKNPSFVDSSFRSLNPFKTSLTFEFFCSTEKSCLIFQNLGNFLFIFSLCINLHFFKHFDKNFNTAFKEVFKKKSKTNVSKSLSSVFNFHR